MTLRCPSTKPLAACVYLLTLATLLPHGLCQTATAKPPQPAGDALPVYIEEFFLADAVRSEERGELQLTVDALSSSGRGSAADGKSADLDIEYGITGRLQLGMGLPYGIQSTPTSELPVSWSSIDLSVLYQFIRSNRPFTLSAAIGAELPLTARGEVSFEPEILVAKGFGNLQIHTSFTPSISEDGKSFEYNVAALHPAPHHLIPTLEFNGRRISGINSFYVTPGLYKHLPHRCEMGVGMPVGIGSRSAPIGAVFKMTIEFGGDDDD